MDDKITYISIKIEEGGKIEIKQEENNIIKKNEEYLVMDDFFFTTICHGSKKDSCHSTLDKVSVFYSNFRVKTMNDYVRGYVYTMRKNKKIIFEKVKKEMKKFIQEKYWFLQDVIDIIDKKVIYK